jgi:hypothetical protein
MTQTPLLVATLSYIFFQKATPVYIYIYIYIQGVTGGTDQTSGVCFLC